MMYFYMKSYFGKLIGRFLWVAFLVLYASET